MHNSDIDEFMGNLNMMDVLRQQDAAQQQQVLDVIQSENQVRQQEAAEQQQVLDVIHSENKLRRNAFFSRFLRDRNVQAERWWRVIASKMQHCPNNMGCGGMIRIGDYIQKDRFKQVHDGVWHHAHCHDRNSWPRFIWGPEPTMPDTSHHSGSPASGSASSARSHPGQPNSPVAPTPAAASSTPSTTSASFARTHPSTPAGSSLSPEQRTRIAANRARAASRRRNANRSGACDAKLPAVASSNQSIDDEDTKPPAVPAPARSNQPIDAEDSKPPAVPAPASSNQSIVEGGTMPPAVPAAARSNQSISSNQSIVDEDTKPPAVPAVASSNQSIYEGDTMPPAIPAVASSNQSLDEDNTSPPAIPVSSSNVSAPEGQVIVELSRNVNCDNIYIIGDNNFAEEDTKPPAAPAVSSSNRSIVETATMQPEVANNEEGGQKPPAVTMSEDVDRRAAEVPSVAQANASIHDEEGNQPDLDITSEEDDRKPAATTDTKVYEGNEEGWQTVQLGNFMWESDGSSYSAVPTSAIMSHCLSPDMYSEVGLNELVWLENEAETARSDELEKEQLKKATTASLRSGKFSFVAFVCVCV